MSYNVKNYTEQGGEKTVIGGEIEVSGTLTVKDGATVTGITGVAGAATATVLGGIKAATKGVGDTVEVKIDSDTSKLYVSPPAIATTDTEGVVKMAANVAKVGEGELTADKFDDLIDALINAGLMADEE